jgi:hypothetical protein
VTSRANADLEAVMTWGATFDVPGSDPEFYDQMVQMVNEMTHGIPEGCIVHIMSPTDDGYRVTEVWESEGLAAVPHRDIDAAPTTGHRRGVPPTTRPTSLPGALRAS